MNYWEIYAIHDVQVNLFIKVVLERTQCPVFHKTPNFLSPEIFPIMNSILS